MTGQSACNVKLQSGNLIFARTSRVCCLLLTSETNAEQWSMFVSLYRVTHSLQKLSICFVYSLRLQATLKYSTEPKCAHILNLHALCFHELHKTALTALKASQVVNTHSSHNHAMIKIGKVATKLMQETTQRVACKFPRLGKDTCVYLLFLFTSKGILLMFAIHEHNKWL